jgi:hypothetical protein
MSEWTKVHLLRGFHARVIRVREALADGDHELASSSLEDLALDLWSSIEENERGIDRIERRAA